MTMTKSGHVSSKNQPDGPEPRRFLVSLLVLLLFDTKEKRIEVWFFQNKSLHLYAETDTYKIQTY